MYSEYGDCRPLWYTRTQSPIQFSILTHGRYEFRYSTILVSRDEQHGPLIFRASNHHASIVPGASPHLQTPTPESVTSQQSDKRLGPGSSPGMGKRIMHDCRRRHVERKRPKAHADRRQEPRMALFVGAVALLVAAAVAQPGEGNHSHHHGGHDDPFAGSGCNCSAFCGECSFVLCQTKYRCVPQSCLMNRAAASLTTHARGAANECSINATGKATITQYRMTQFGVVDMRNKNTCVRARPHQSRRSIALVQCPVDRSTPIR